jgi:hypothetical protein
MKILFFVGLLFNSFSPPIEAGCKGKNLFSTLATTLKINFRGLERNGTGSKTSDATWKFLTVSIFLLKI